MTEAEWKVKTAAFLAELAQLYDKHGLFIDESGNGYGTGVRLALLEGDGVREVFFIDKSYYSDEHR